MAETQHPVVFFWGKHWNHAAREHAHALAAAMNRGDFHAVPTQPIVREHEDHDR